MEILDWVLVAVFFAVIIYFNLRLRKQASTDLASFFLGGRKLPWYLAGVSMVATTFAADTPLWVAEKISQHGISGNWLWWNMLIGGMLTTFFFSHLWRRSNVLTELEFLELRYGGKAAAFLRGFRAIYLGVFMNAVIIGWVNFALATILRVFFGIEGVELMMWIFGAMLFVGIYSSISGLIGVAVTDAIQFIVAMVGCVVLAFFVLQHPSVGGITGLKAQLPSWRFDFFPHVNNIEAIKEAGIYSIAPLAFVSFAAVQWWASWYPGAEPGGGGYVAQRMMSAKNEKHAVWATLFFQVTHYCLRPWPWIITGLCLLLIYPDTNPENAAEHFIMAIKDILPAGLKGLLLAAFLGAYMSTISTQLNWGAGFLTSDFIIRFFYKKNKPSDTKQVWIGRYCSLLLMLTGMIASVQITTLDGAARFLIECGAGLGLVLILRWYWWRVSAWSEIAATIAPILFYIVFHHVIIVEAPLDFLLTVLCSTASWLIVTFLTPAESDETLQRFCKVVRPDGFWRNLHQNPKNGKMVLLLKCWVVSILFTYGILIGIGKWIFMEYKLAIIYTLVALFTGWLLVLWVPKALAKNEE